MSDRKQEQMRDRLLKLKEEHRDLDSAINAVLEKGAFDQLQLQRLKKRKLQLKDDIARVKDFLYPDIIA